jgi:endonuclease/exonuclease/phosphatase (EEP) superfamily protein YafD
MALKRNPRSPRFLRVLTANLYADRLNLEAFRELLKEIDPDVAMVQELSFVAAEVLGGLLPHGMLLPEEGHDGRGVALKAPAEMERLPMAYRDGLIARLEAPAWPGSLEIVNIHMMNPIVWPPWNASRLRSQQLGVLLAHLESPGARLIAGDFNASPVWLVYRRLAYRLNDAALLVAKEKGRSAARTWGPTPSSPRLLRIDHVFVEGLRPVDVHRVEVPGSDHSGLLVDLDLG